MSAKAGSKSKVNRKTSAKEGATREVKSPPDKTATPSRKMSAKQGATSKVESPPEKTRTPSGRKISAKEGDAGKVKSPPEKTETPSRKMSAKQGATSKVESPPGKTRTPSGRKISAKEGDAGKVKSPPEKTETPSRKMSAKQGATSKVESPPEKTRTPSGRKISAKEGDAGKVKSPPEKTETPSRKMSAKQGATSKVESPPEKTRTPSGKVSAKEGATCKVKSPPEKTGTPSRKMSAKEGATCKVKSPPEKTATPSSMKLSEYLPRLGKETLQEFVERYLGVTYKGRMNQTIDHLQRHLEKLPDYSIAGTFRTGSMAKCTAVKATADIDLLVFFDGYRNMQEFIQDKESDDGILQAIERHLTTDPVYSKNWECTKIARGYHVTVKMVEYSILVDILPARQYRMAMRDAIYNQMKREPGSVRNHYSVCLAPIQCDFMKNQPRQVHHLVKLLKYWKSENEIKLKSYFCELLAVHIFKTKLDKNVRFDLKEGFVLALTQLQNYNSLEITFSDYYKPDVWKDERPCKPYVMDPANPFMNTCNQYLDSSDMDRMVTCATNTISAISNRDC
ncbi:microtubule-associated protein futsch isoform X6 [Patella vulgata]|uniref:microtubule-associated protein futsch isoform X6 n=1 Tax=Patella vulgata TaxID=6465 RepID=UPI0024A9DB4E|nr:microtubule-associated protein futsch isoform X6 [Patella vulgata]